MMNDGERGGRDGKGDRFFFLKREAARRRGTRRCFLRGFKAVGIFVCYLFYPMEQFSERE